MLTQDPKPPDPDQIFSHPGQDAVAKDSMLGERNVDSVLFKVTDLPDAEPPPVEDSAKIDLEPPPRKIEDAKMSSGLVDINAILEQGESSDEAPAAVGSLVAEMKLQAREPDAVPVAAPQSKTQTYVLVAGILALLAVAIMLAIKAVG